MNTCFHLIWRFVCKMSEDMCAICLDTSFNLFWKHVSTMFEDMFTPCLITYSMHCLVHVYTIFKDIFRLVLKTCLHNVWRDIFIIIWRQDYTLFENFLNNVWRHYSKFFRLFQGFHTVHEDIFAQRHPVDGIFTKCLNPYIFKIDQIVFVVKNGWKFKIIELLQNLP